MAHSRAVVWIDPQEARLLALDAGARQRRIPSGDADCGRARDSGNVRDEHFRDNRQFFEAVLAAVEGDLDEDGRWLIVGAQEPVRDFSKYVKDHAEALAAKLVGVESLDRPNEGKVLDAARRRFGASA